jgi:hypothetical protein
MESRAPLALAAVGLAALALVPAASARGLQLFHDSFSATYRSPGGADPTGTNVTLRLRVTGGKTKSVTLRLVAGNPATDTSRQSDVRMTRHRRARCKATPSA